MNKSVMKCCICNNENIGQFITINNKKYHLCCIEQLQQENKQLKMINKEYERLNKEKNRGFKIIDVQEYDRYELLSYKNYKDNWNKLKEYIEKDYGFYDKLIAPKYGCAMGALRRIKDKMQKLEQGSDSNE